GMSNGGFMSYHLACNLSNKIAAVASVTGSMVPGAFAKCNPGRTIPALEIHGTADDVVLYNGNSTLNESVESVKSFWANNNECVDSISVEFLPNTNTQDQSTVEKHTHFLCKNDHKVVLYKVIGGGHTWPGATLSIGVTNRDINANEEIWNFFKQYSLPTTNAVEDLLSPLEIYPNPAHDMLYIKTENPIQQIQIINTQGQIVRDFQFHITNHSVDISNLISGMYFLQIPNQKNRTVYRFIKF
ncbi:MAG: T9SS type A sorting domain-containing protein, partial [Saprospiraceae bacterium]